MSTSVTTVMRQRMAVPAFAHALICGIGALAGAHTDSALPDIFPEDHNLVAGTQLLDRFAEDIDIASSGHVQNGSICGVGAPRQEWESCQDSDRRCGAWASM